MKVCIRPCIPDVCKRGAARGALVSGMHEKIMGLSKNGKAEPVLRAGVGHTAQAGGGL